MIRNPDSFTDIDGLGEAGGWLGALLVGYYDNDDGRTLRFAFSISCCASARSSGFLATCATPWNGSAWCSHRAWKAIGPSTIWLYAPSTRGGRSRIRTRLTEGSVVTTLKNTVDKVVTEFGVAELRGHTIRDRARALIAVAQEQADQARVGWIAPPRLDRPTR